MGPVNTRSQPNAPHAGHGLGETDPLEPPLQGRRFVGNAWRRLHHWVRANTFAPSWLPARLRHPALGYVAAVILEVIAVVLTLLLTDLPTFNVPGLLVVLVVVLVALNWGGGPSLLATLVGGALLDFVIFPSRFGWSFATATDGVPVGLVLSGGLPLSLLAWAVPRAADHAHAEAGE